MTMLFGMEARLLSMAMDISILQLVKVESENTPSTFPVLQGKP